MIFNGIDVSSYQGRPDWKNVKNADIDFAILRVANSKGMDSSFEHNYKGCIANGMSVGIYRYSYALTAEQAKAEAQEVLNILKTRKLHLGVWLDLEWDRQMDLGKNAITKIAVTWMKVITQAGYSCGIYCNHSWYKSVLDTDALPVEYWIARYPTNDTGVIREALRPNTGELAWQYSSKGRVAGIEGNVDMNIWYGEMAAPQISASPQNPYKEPAETLKYVKVLLPFVRNSVKWLQWELVQKGYDIRIDGKFGVRTDMALRAEQGRLGIAVDGQCGAITRLAILKKFK